MHVGYSLLELLSFSPWFQDSNCINGKIPVFDELMFERSHIVIQRLLYIEYFVNLYSAFAQFARRNDFII
jgi:hypothetical protein